MKILFTGGGTGGHFYPIIAVAEAIRDRATERKILPPAFYYMAPSKYNPRALFDNEIQFVYTPAGKVRRYFSILNITDIFKTISGMFIAILRMYTIYPDVVFGKGGYASFPALFAAKILRIPVVIHESDSAPGRVNSWAGRFAERVAISYPDSAKYFKRHPDRVAHTGNPIRKGVIQPLTNGAREYLKLEENTPVILVLGGSQGSVRINDVLMGALPELLNRYQVIHQTGRANLEEIKLTAGLVLKDHPYSHRYHPMDYLNDLAIRMSAGVASVVISRAGSTIFEVAAWGLPSIIIPLSEEVSHDQKINAFSYARTGAAAVIEEANVTPHVLIEEIDHICKNQAIAEKMRSMAKEFARLDSATTIADAILDIGLRHER